MRVAGISLFIFISIVKLGCVRVCWGVFVTLVVVCFEVLGIDSVTLIFFWLKNE